MTGRPPHPASPPRAGERRKARLLAIALGVILLGAAPGPVPLQFPRDHGSHPDASVEWWYYTGHLTDPAGHPYGFQLTFFRVGELALAHFGWTDGGRGTFSFAEKSHLTLPGIAEFAEGRLDVSNEDWSAAESGGVHRLQMGSPERAISLELAAAKPPLLQGDRGFSRKGPGENEYSHYVSIPRLSARGTLTGGGRTVALTGTAWFDHEWGPGVLPAAAAGWDWFAIQLDDRSELMLYRMRTKEGGATPFSSGVFVPPAGPPVPLRWEEVRLESTGRWRSSKSGSVYPSGWKISVPRLSLEASLTPLVADQELSTGRSTGVTYWEGACRVEGSRSGRPITGRAYAELTGYAQRDLPGFAGR